MSNTGLGKNLFKLYELYTENGGIVTTDSRAVAALGAPLFFALRGDRFDGNDYAIQAIADGAIAAVVHGKLPDGVSPGSEEAAKYIVVKDSLAALQELASYHRDMLGLPVIALTGSNGKTTTKELIVRVLRTKYRVACTRGNLNNHIGVPLTLLSVTEEDDIAIIEMGANHRGEIAALCEIAQPDIGLITNVGRAHLEGFGGPEGVRLGKGELYDCLARRGGTVIYAADDPVLAGMAAERFGEASEEGSAIGYTATGYGITAAGTDGDHLVIALSGFSEAEVRTHMTGVYNLSNVTAALAVGDYFGIPLPNALEAVAAYEPDNNRSQVALSANATGNTLYMDAYNANPSSMSAALDNFFGLPDVDRKVLIIGDMRELGDYSQEEHEAIIDRLVAVSSEADEQEIRVCLVGPEFTAALQRVDAVPAHIRGFADVSALADALSSGDVVIQDAHVLVKGSRGIALEQLYPLL